jgi:hypothetical protein
VLANAGSGFQNAGNGASLAPGTRVLAKPAASAVIVYENGCSEPVQPGQIVTVKVDFACQSALGAGPQFVLGAAVVGAGVAIAVNADAKPASP